MAKGFSIRHTRLSGVDTDDLPAASEEVVA